MKKFFLAVVLSNVLSLFSWSQGQKLKLAAKEYALYDYSEAAGHLEKMPKNDIALRALGDSYYKTQQYTKSEIAYAQLVAFPSVTPADMANYINVLLVNEKYQEAMNWMEKFSSAYPSDGRYSGYLSENNLIEKLKTDAGQFSIRNLDINSVQEDFGPVFYRDNIVFTSSREEVGPVKRTWNGNKLPYLDLYSAVIDSKGELKTPELFYNTVNRKYHDGPASFTKDASVIAFTRNNYETKSSDGVRKLQLFTSKLKREILPGDQVFYGWTEPVGVSFNSNEYSVGHPAFNEDGTVMYFISDMPGGRGGTDLYKAHKNPDGTWEAPQNLGEKINTPGDEMFPFLHSSGLLFFSSTGHEGLGGLDVFAARVGAQTGKIINVGAPINSSKDDFSFILNEGMSFGYFASNREGGKGNDDIYYYQLLKPIRFEKTISGTAKSKDGKILDPVNVVLKDESGKEIKSTMSDANGKFYFETEEDKLYTVSGFLKNYTEDKKAADARTGSDEIRVDLILEPMPSTSVYFDIRDKKSSRPLSGVKISVMDNSTGGEVASFVTDTTGSKRMPIIDKAEGSPYNYLIKMTKDGYLSKSVTLQGTMKTGEIKMAEALGKIEIGTDLGKILDIKPIYFNLGKSDIRKDATAELDKIIKVMNENPGMEIELGSHTDCRGTAAANFSLSDNRAKSSAEYVKKKISNPSRIYGKGYGESVPVNDCKCEGIVKSACSEEGHQKNRRTEFKVIKM